MSLFPTRFGWATAAILATVLLAAFIYLFRPILTPFLIGTAVAYLLNPLVVRLSHRGLSRAAAAGIVLAIFIGALVVAAAVAVPIVGAQASQLVARAPGYGRALADMATSQLLPFLHAHVDDATFQQAREALSGFSSTALGWAGDAAKGVLAGGGGLFSMVSVVFLSPIVSFYLMRDWPRCLDAVTGHLPRRLAPTVSVLATEIDGRVAAFIRGQGLVALSLATFYVVGLSLTGLEFGAVIGLAAGLLSFIPYVGLVSGVVAAGIMAVVQFHSASGVAMVLGVFAVAQVLDAGFLTPKLVGERIGLHPVWIIFAVMGGSVLAGFVGVLLAVPTAAAVAVVVSHLSQVYRTSHFYAGDAA